MYVWCFCLLFLWSNFRRNPQVSELWDQGRIVEGLNAIDWSSDTIQDLENTVLNGITEVYCGSVSLTMVHSLCSTLNFYAIGCGFFGWFSNWNPSSQLLLSSSKPVYLIWTQTLLWEAGKWYKWYKWCCTWCVTDALLPYQLPASRQCSLHCCNRVMVQCTMLVSDLEHGQCYVCTLLATIPWDQEQYSLALITEL